MSDTRHKNTNWELPTSETGRIKDWAYVNIAVLMDIRDELQKLNRVFECQNFIRIPQKLDTIARSAETLVAALPASKAKKKLAKNKGVAR